MEVLLIFIVAVGFITVIGHLIWLALAAAFRLLFPGRPQENSEPRHERRADAELRELEVTTRTIGSLLARGDLDHAAAERVERCLEARRRSLREKDDALAAKRLRPAPGASVARMEELLGKGVHPRDLVPTQRRAALACYRQLNNSQRAALNAPTLLALARLLDLAGMTSHAVNAYRRLLHDHPDLADRAQIALEAGRIAVKENLTELARHFLQMALAGVLAVSDYDEARTLLARLDEAVQAPAAIAVVEPTPGTPISRVAVEEEPIRRLAFPAVTAEATVRPLPAPAAPAMLVPPPPRPRRALTTLLAGFMEERNILWGELAGGLLIVGCSIALVITLWHSLEELPYFPFLIFASITAALFAAGEYTLHHWKLESTSRGLLVIALLLVPLNLLVLADPSLAHANSALELTFKAAAVLLSLGMIRLAGRDLIGVDVLPGPIDRRWLFMLAIVGAAGSQLIVPHLLDEPHPILFVLLGCVPVACHLLACGAVVAGLHRARTRAENRGLELRQAHALFVFLGLASFALFVALGFLLSRSGDLARALPRLAMPFALAGVPILAGGLLVRRSLRGEDAGAARTAGTAVAFTGLTIMLSAVILAWPQPLAVFLVCLSNVAILSALAFRWHLPSAHVVALPCLALAVLIVVQFALGNLAVPAEAAPGWWLAEQLVSPSSGVVLAVLMALLATGAECLARAGQRIHATSYALGCAALGVCALLTTASHGIGAPWSAAVVHTLAALCALALYVRWPRPALPYSGLGLLVAASLWCLWAVAPANFALWGFLVALESAALMLAAVGSHPLRRACRDVAAVAAVLALVLAFVTPDFPAQGLHTGTGSVLALSVILLAHLVRRAGLAWLGSTLFFLALAHLFIWDLDASGLPHPLLVALLAHATLALGGALAPRVRFLAGDQDILRAPLRQSAQLTSLLAVPLLFLPGVAPLILAGYTLWLAVLFLAIAGMRRSPAWFTPFQAALSTAALFAVTACLPSQQDWFDPRSLQAYGVGLALLGLGWIAARAGLLSHPRVRELWQAAWPALDRVVLGSLIAAQFTLALWGISAGVNAELIPAGYVSALTWPPAVVHAYGPGAWVLLGVLALVLLAALREKGRASVILGLLMLAVTVPILAAGPFADELATASALRWGLALCYLVCSAFVWLRRGLTRLTPFVADSPSLPWAHGLLGVVAASVLLLTSQVAVLGFVGLRPTGPASASFFAQMGWVVSNVTPLVLLTVGLVGHAIRERSPAYAFMAGLIANVSLTGGYTLSVVTSGHHFDTAETVFVLQLASMMAALWALAWMMIRPRIAAWHDAADCAPSPLAQGLMVFQIGLVLAGQLVLLGSAVVSLGALQHALTPWTVATGSLAGWGALLASLLALIVWHLQQRRPTPWGFLFVGGLAAVSLLACTGERTWPDAGYTILLLGWPLHVLLWALLPVLNGGLTAPEPSLRELTPAAQESFRLFSFAGFKLAAPMILLPCVPSILWALNVAGTRQEYLWAAAAVSLSALAAALLGVWRRSEELAFFAGLGVNLAASLFVWHLWHPIPPSWLSLVQANVLASASVALVWLGIRHRLPDRRPGPLLAVQAALGLVACTILLSWPFVEVLDDPAGQLDPFFADIGSAVGWLALLLSAAASFWYLAVRLPSARIHVLGILGLSVGVLSACMASPWDNGNWQSFHVLELTWSVLGLIATVAGFVTFSLGRAPLPDRLPPCTLRRWLEGIGFAILVLALRGVWQDPWRPIGSAAAVLVVSLMAGALSLWSRRHIYIWGSGLLLNLLGILFWSAWGPSTAVSFLLTNALGLAGAAALWNIVELALSEPLPRENDAALALDELPSFTFAYCAANVALGLVVLVVILLLGSDLMPPVLAVSHVLAWSAVAAVALALVVALWDRRAWFAAPGLYLLGLAAVGLTLHGLGRTPAGLGWNAALVLAVYTVLASMVFHIFNRSPRHWFIPAQAGVSCVIVALSLWMCLDFATLVDRLAGPAAVLLLIPAALILLARDARPQAGFHWLRPATLVFATLAAAEMGYAFPDPSGAAAWLHRNVLLMVALAAMTALCGVVLPRWLTRDAEWVRWGRRFGPLLGVLASLTLLVLLVQEFRLYDAATRRTPMAGSAVLVVLAAFVTLMVSGILFAVVPGRDPFGFSERGRTLYVYAVELLLVLLFVHVRLNVPELFRGWAGKYWTIIIMLIAYIGVGLSEFFERRKLRVLAEPLQRTGVFLPLLPLLAFWAKPPASLLNFADNNAPGLRPMLGYLDKLPQNFDSYAFLWLLVAGLLGLVSLTRQSFRFTLLAVLAANCALWSLLTHHGVAFFFHPQCWLIPLALIVLAAEHVNRDHLRAELSAGLRYLGINMIYVSSTAELFITGLGNSIVLPIFLAVLSLAGILVGILFRVRAFLFLGISFLFLDVFTMIWYAAVDRYQTWVWWVSGIILGAAILTLFAVFEKRRNDVLHLLDDIKHWD